MTQLNTGMTNQCKHHVWKASEILRHAEEAAAEQLRGTGKPVMDNARGVPDTKSLEAVVGGN